MGEASDSIEVICPKCRKKLLVPVRGLDYDEATQCDACRYSVFTHHKTFLAFQEAIAERDSQRHGEPGT